MRILIVDDQPLTRRGLAATFAAEPDLTVCGEAATAETGWSLFLSECPDVIVLEMPVAGGNTLDLIRQITSRNPEVAVVVVTNRAEALCAERALRAGARGYVLKSEPCEVLVDTIRKVRTGSYVLNSDVNDALLRAIVNQTTTLIKSPHETLSERELAVFEMSGQGLSMKEIADEMALSAKTVESYRNRIKAKLGLHNTADLLQEAARWRDNSCECYHWKVPVPSTIPEDGDRWF